MNTRLLGREGDIMEVTFIRDSFMEGFKHFCKSHEQLGTPWAVTISQSRAPLVTVRLCLYNWEVHYEREACQFWVWH